MANKKTIVLIGNTEFPNSSKELCPLPDAEKAIDTFEEVMTVPALGDAERLRLIDLPHYQINTEVYRVFREAGRDDVVFLYYCGHATRDFDQQLYLATSDTDLRLLRTTSICAGNLANLLRGTQCRRIGVIMDLYHSPSLQDRELESLIDGFFDQLISAVRKGYSLSVLVHSQQENGTARSNPLIETVVEGIESGDADSNRDGSITTDELADHAISTFTQKGLKPPIWRCFGAQNSFIVCKSTGQMVTVRVLDEIRDRLKDAVKNQEIDKNVVQDARAILDKEHGEIEQHHPSAFKLLREWSEDNLSKHDFLTQWYQLEGTRLPETEAPTQSTALRERWEIIRNYRGTMQDLIGPAYILDRNFQFLDWNPMFDELVARPLGLLRGRHVEDFILELENKSEVIARSNKIFKKNLYPIVDVEPLILETRYGRVEFKKIASRIPNDKNIDLWSVNLNIISAENSALMWRDLRKRVKRDVNWSLYAKAYDRVLLNFDSYNALVSDVVTKVGNGGNIVDLASGTGNVTVELLRRDAARTIWALEYNQEMLEYMWDKVAGLNAQAVDNVNIVKGDLILSLREFDHEYFEGAVMMNALYAMDDRARCLREIYRVLKPGAVLVFSSSTKNTDVEYLFRQIRRNLDKKGLLDSEMASIVDGAYDRHLEMLDAIHSDTHEDLIDYARAAGFVVDEQEDVVQGAYEGAVTVVRARKRKPVIPTRDPPRVAANGRSSGDDVADVVRHHKRNADNGVNVFISYAHEDSVWCEKLKRYLGPITTENDITIWTDHEIEYGDRWRDLIKQQLEESNLALLLISVAFLDSTFIANNELPSLLHSANSKGLKIIPIILEKCLYDSATFKYPDPELGPNRFKLSEFQTAGTLTKPLNALSVHEQNEIFYEVAQRIKSLTA